MRNQILRSFIAGDLAVWLLILSILSRKKRAAQSCCSWGRTCDFLFNLDKPKKDIKVGVATKCFKTFSCFTNLQFIGKGHFGQDSLYTTTSQGDVTWHHALCSRKGAHWVHRNLINSPSSSSDILKELSISFWFVNKYIYIYIHCQYIYIYIILILVLKGSMFKEVLLLSAIFFGECNLLTKFLISDPSSDSSSFRNFSVWLFCKYTRRACNGKSRKPLKPCFPHTPEKKKLQLIHISHIDTHVYALD